MPGSRSNDKGDRYEREVADILSDWSGLKLCRTPRGAPEEIYADVWPVNVTDYLPLAVECKCVEGWSFDQIMRGTGSWFGWLDQTYTQAITAEHELGRLHVPMLVFSKNRFPNWVAVPVQYGLRDSALYNSSALRYMSVTGDKGLQYVIHELDRYLGLVTFSRFMGYVKMYKAIDSLCDA